MLITGGSGSVGNTTELYVPSLPGLSCPLPSLPTGRYFHTVDSSGLLCGGWESGGTRNTEYTTLTTIEYTENTCLHWRPDTGTWEDYIIFDLSDRWLVGHMTWTPESGIGTYLMGGGYPGPNPTRTTLIKPDGTQEPGFPLRQNSE